MDAFSCKGLQGARCCPAYTIIPYGISQGSSLTERFNLGAIFLTWLQVKATRRLAMKPDGQLLIALLSVTRLLVQFSSLAALFLPPAQQRVSDRPSTACVINEPFTCCAKEEL